MNNFQKKHIENIRDQVADELLSLRETYPDVAFVKIDGEDKSHEFSAYLVAAFNAQGVPLLTSQYFDDLEESDLQVIDEDVLNWIGYEDFVNLVGDLPESCFPSSVLNNPKQTFLNDDDGRRYSYIFNLDALNKYAQDN